MLLGRQAGRQQLTREEGGGGERERARSSLRQNVEVERSRKERSRGEGEEREGKDPTAAVVSRQRLTHSLGEREQNRTQSDPDFPKEHSCERERESEGIVLRSSISLALLCVLLLL